MHELSIAEALLDLIQKRAACEGIKKVYEINLKIGEFSGVFIDSLRFAFEMLSKDTITEGASLNIETTPGYELQVISFEGD
ncbi:MAG: hydrogenase maturation nickel metallochaperone HypA/HybF [Spirochaetota bacterium]